MQIRNVISADDFYDMRKSVTWKEISKNQLKKSLESSMIVIGIYENNEIVAMGRLVGDFCLKGMLTDIIVKPKYQKQGYGKIVVTKILEYAKDFISSGETICIEGSPTNNNRDFYVNCGLKYKPKNQDGVYVWLYKE